MSGSTTTGGGMGVESETLIGEVARIPKRRSTEGVVYC